MSTVLQQGLLLNELERPKSSLGVFELPCGYLDEEGVLHREVELSELTGNEEDLLASPTIPVQRKMGLLIGRCIKRLGTITDRGKIAMISEQLTIGDRVFLLFALRRITLGDSYPFKITCPTCNKESMHNVDMAELRVQPMNEPEKRIYDVTIPSGKTVRFKIMTGEDEGKLSKIKKLEDKLSVALLVRVELLNGKPPTLDDIKGLTIKERDDLRAMMDECDGGIDTTVETSCPLCSSEFETEIDAGQAGFFFPQTQRKRLKM